MVFPRRDAVYSSWDGVYAISGQDFVQTKCHIQQKLFLLKKQGVTKLVG